MTNVHHIGDYYGMTNVHHIGIMVRLMCITLGD